MMAESWNEILIGTVDWPHGFECERKKMRFKIFSVFISLRSTADSAAEAEMHEEDADK